MQERAQSQQPGAQLQLKDRIRTCPWPQPSLLPVCVGEEGDSQMDLCQMSSEDEFCIVALPTTRLA